MGKKQDAESEFEAAYKAPKHLIHVYETHFMCNFRERHGSTMLGVFWVPHATPVVLPAPWPHAGFLPACQGAQISSSLTYSPVLLFISYPTSRCFSATWFHFKSNRSFCHCPTPKGAMNSWLCWIEPVTPVFFTASKSQCCFLSIDSYWVIAILETLSAVYQKHRQPVKMLEGQKTVKPPSFDSGSL